MKKLRSETFLQVPNPELVITSLNYSARKTSNYRAQDPEPLARFTSRRDGGLAFPPAVLTGLTAGLVQTSRPAVPTGLDDKFHQAGAGDALQLPPTEWR